MAQPPILANLAGEVVRTGDEVLKAIWTLHLLHC
jgi:hypothetical protein